MMAGARSRPESTIDRATLVQIARDTAAQRTAARPSLLSAYAIGSVAAGEPLLGEATDIDLVFIDSQPPPVAREVIRLTDQVALDIHYRYRADYANPKALRVHPWRGPEMAEPLFLHDPTHFFELAQASARGQFHRAENVAHRARTFAAWARQALHVGLLPGAEPEAPVTVADLCQALLFAANAVITLVEFPAAGRRLVMKLDGAARRLGRPELYHQFLALLGGPDLPPEQAEALVADWSLAYRAGQSSADELIHPARRSIYERGFRAQILADRAPDILWLMLLTWDACMQHAPADPGQTERWRAFTERLGLAPEEAYAERVRQAADYVTVVNRVVEVWAESNGG